MKDTEYLLTYISNDTYKKLLKKNSYKIEDIINNRRDTELNIKYLIKLGIKNIDYITLERLDDLLLSHHEFMNKINNYLKNLTKEELINMLENS